jgi:hypothetical protein
LGKILRNGWKCGETLKIYIIALLQKKKKQCCKGEEIKGKAR